MLKKKSKFCNTPAGLIALSTIYMYHCDRATSLQGVTYRKLANQITRNEQ